MFILSAPLSAFSFSFSSSASPSSATTTIYISSAPTPRVSIHSISSSFFNFSSPLSLRFTSTSRRSAATSPCFLRLRAMAELVHDKEVNAFSSGGGAGKELDHSRIFLDARSKQEVLTGIRKETESGRLPLTVATGMEELYHNYKNAVFQSGNPKAEETVLSNMSVTLDRALLDVEDPFVFSPYHKAMREPFDYYMFGQNYIRPLVDFENSFVGNISVFYEMEEKLKQGQNIILISNHQTEADPAVIALLLETTNSSIAENLVSLKLIVDKLTVNKSGYEHLKSWNYPIPF